MNKGRSISKTPTERRTWPILVYAVLGGVRPMSASTAAAQEQSLDRPAQI